VQMAFAVVAFQSAGIADSTQEKQSEGEKSTPRPRLQTEPGAPSVSLYFPETSGSDILSLIVMSTDFRFPNAGHPPTIRFRTEVGSCG
jgi:hypothetical protein